MPRAKMIDTKLATVVAPVDPKFHIVSLSLCQVDPEYSCVAEQNRQPTPCGYHGALAVLACQFVSQRGASGVLDRLELLRLFAAAPTDQMLYI